MEKSKIVTHRVVLCVLTALMISFIFLNSALDADSSNTYSFGVREFINSVLQSLNISITLTEHFVRKTAHFVEFFVLGALLFATVRSFIKELGAKLLFAPCIGLLVACIDEFIQRFSVGRSCQLTDVLLDFSGVCTAVILLYLISKLCSKKSKEVLN